MKPERLAAADHKSAGRNLRNSVAAEETLHFAYESFGPAGTITKETLGAVLGLTLVTFATAAQLNLRPTAFEPGRFRLRVVFPHNFSDVPVDAGASLRWQGNSFSTAISANTASMKSRAF